MIENNTMNEEFVRICPLCKSCIRSFYINFNEKILMCENTSCEYPFGYEDVQYYRVDDEADCDVDRNTISSHARRSASTSTLSLSAWSEIEKMDRVNESEDLQLDDRTVDRKTYESVKVTNVDETLDDKRIKKNVRDLKGLSDQLCVIERQSNNIIKNEKWIKNLMNLQGLSGVQLVKQQEIEQLKERQPAFRGGELKIDIDTNQSMSSIKIEIMNTSQDNVVQGLT